MRQGCCGHSWLRVYCVTVRELKSSYHNMYTHIYPYSTYFSPVLNRKSLIKTQLRLSLAKHGFVATLRYSHALVLTGLSLQ